MDIYELQEFQDEIKWYFEPEPDEDGLVPREMPNERLKDVHNLDFSYMDSFNWEGSSVHEYTRICPVNEQAVRTLTRTQDVPDRLFRAALRLYADSILQYGNSVEEVGDLKFYPPIILTFWAGFESFVRYSCHLLIATSNSLPPEVCQYLSETERFVDPKGRLKTRMRFHSVIDRYVIFLKYAYNFEIDKGEAYWQALIKAKKLRDYFTHVDVTDPRKITSNQVVEFLESVLLAMIIPSSRLNRTLMLGQYWHYDIFTIALKYTVSYTEQPMFIDWGLTEEYLFHCNFENVDESRFKSVSESLNDEIDNQ